MVLTIVSQYLSTAYDSPQRPRDSLGCKLLREHKYLYIHTYISHLEEASTHKSANRPTTAMYFVTRDLDV